MNIFNYITDIYKINAFIGRLFKDFQEDEDTMHIYSEWYDTETMHSAICCREEKVILLKISL